MIVAQLLLSLRNKNTTMYKDKRICIKAMLLPEDFNKFAEICKEKNISKVEQLTTLVKAFNSNHNKKKKKILK